MAATLAELARQLAEPASFKNQVSLAGRVASLTWAPRNLTGGTQLTSGHLALATGLGVTVHRLIYEGGSRRAFDITAQFVYRGRALESRATVTDSWGIPLR
jgi:hypothetical protein